MDPQWHEVTNNVCGVVQDCRDAYTVANAFVGDGWSRRSSSWYGWEVETSWGQIELDSLDGREVLLNGVADPARFDELAGILSAFGVRFTLELYNDAGDLLREMRG